MMHVLRLVGFAPLSMELESVDLVDAPPPGHLLVEARTSAISVSTEIANFRDHAAHSAEQPYCGIARTTGKYPPAAARQGRREGVTGSRWRPRLRLGTAWSGAVGEAGGFAWIPDGVSFDHAAMTT